MATFNRYTIREIIRSSLPAFVGLTSLVVIGFSVKLLRLGVDVVRLRAIVPFLFAYAGSAVINAALLTAVIMCFGRMTEDNELLAVKCGGVHPRRVVTPVLFFAACVAVFAIFLQVYVVPWSRSRIGVLKFTALKEVLASKLAVNAVRQIKVPGYVVAYKGYSAGKIQDVQVLQLDRGVIQTIISAREGAILLGSEKSGLPILRLTGCSITSYGGHTGRKGSEELVCKEIRLRLPLSGGRDRVQRMSYLPFHELVDYRRELRRSLPDDLPRFDHPRTVIARLKREERELVGDINQVRDRIEPLTERERSKRLDVDAALRRLDAAQIRIGNEQEALDALRQELRERTSQAQKLRDAREGKVDYEQLAAVEKRLEQLPELIRKRVEDLQQLAADQTRFREEYFRHDRELEKLRAELATLTERRGELESRRENFQRRYRNAYTQQRIQRVSIQIHKSLALGASCVAFALIGIPFGILAHRGNIVIALGLSFAVVLLVFFPILIASELFAQNGYSPLWLWSSNVLLAFIGVGLLRRVVRT
jgi:lipopolysaccharide export LptBFGC system permease protein LptF